MRFIAYNVIKVSNHNKFLEKYCDLIFLLLPIPIFLYLRGGRIDEYTLNLLSFNQISWLYPYFVFGFIIGRYKEVEGLIKNEKISALFILLYIIFFNKYIFNVNTMSIKMYPWAFCIIIFIYSNISNWVSKSNSIFSSRVINMLSSLGQNSLAIYLLHYIFLQNGSIYQIFSSNNYLESISKDIFPNICIEIFCSVLLIFTTLLPTYILVLIIKNNKFLSKILLGDV